MSLSSQLLHNMPRRPRGSQRRRRRGVALLLKPDPIFRDRARDLLRQAANCGVRHARAMTPVSITIQPGSDPVSQAIPPLHSHRRQTTGIVDLGRTTSTALIQFICRLNGVNLLLRHSHWRAVRHEQIEKNIGPATTDYLAAASMLARYRVVEPIAPVWLAGHTKEPTITQNDSQYDRSCRHAFAPRHDGLIGQGA
jgi:hypothetical protein